MSGGLGFNNFQIKFMSLSKAPFSCPVVVMDAGTTFVVELRSDFFSTFAVVVNYY